MSPEQVQSDKVVPQSDLFSLGCVLYTMLAGRNPFHAQTSVAMGHRVATLAPPPISKVRDGIPPSLDQLVGRLLQKKPSDRPAKASDVASVLHRLLVAVNQSDHGLKLAADAPTLRQRRTAVAAAAAVMVAVALGVWQGVGPPAASGEPKSPAAVAPPSRIAGQGPILVSAAGQTAFRSLSEALRAAGPGTLIQVDEGDYQESIRLDDPERHRNVTIEAIGDARLSHQAATSIIAISGVPGVTVRGLTITAHNGQRGIQLTGSCPGVTIESCELRSGEGPAGMAAMLNLARGASGSADAPLRISKCRLRNCRIGMVIGPDEFSDRKTRDVVIEKCEVHCAATDIGIPILLWGQLRNIRVQGNLFSRGGRSLSLQLDDPHSAHNVVLRNNTFHSPSAAINFNASTAAQGVLLQSNLFVQCDRTHPTGNEVEEYRSWFRDNVWIVSGKMDETMLSILAWQWFETDVFASLNPDDPDYLKPSKDAPEEFVGWLSDWSTAIGPAVSSRPRGPNSESPATTL